MTRDLTRRPPLNQCGQHERGVGLTGLLIPLVSVDAALTLLPAALLVAGPAMEWLRRRKSNPVSRLWQAMADLVVRHRWWAVAVSLVALLALAHPALGLNLGSPSNASLGLQQRPGRGLYSPPGPLAVERRTLAPSRS